MKSAAERRETNQEAIKAHKLEALERLMDSAENQGLNKISVSSSQASNEIIKELLNLGYRIHIEGIQFPDGTFAETGDTQIHISW